MSSKSLKWVVGLLSELFWPVVFIWFLSVATGVWAMERRVVRLQETIELHGECIEALFIAQESIRSSVRFPQKGGASE